MAEVLSLSLSFPAVIYTALLGVVLVYWLFVIVGAIDLSHGSEGALDGLGGDSLIGAAKGSMEGAAKGLLEGSAASSLEAADGGEFADGGDGTDVHHGALPALLSALGLRSVPVTIVASLLITFSWLVATVLMQLVVRDAAALRGWLAWLVLVIAPVLALPLTAIAARPLSPLFAHRRAPAKSDLLGKTCVVRTGRVTSKFGEALLENGGPGLVVSIRFDGDHQLKRGDVALLVDWDPHRDSFIVEPMAQLLSHESTKLPPP